MNEIRIFESDNVFIMAEIPEKTDKGSLPQRDGISIYFERANEIVAGKAYYLSFTRADALKFAHEVINIFENFTDLPGLVNKSISQGGSICEDQENPATGQRQGK